MKKISPKEAKTFDQICMLQTDGWDTKNSWICLGEETVTICLQKNYQKATDSVTLDRKEFERLANWYFRPQRLRKS
jgi:hypothetical protein